jgi:hypothetical protein
MLLMSDLGAIPSSFAILISSSLRRHRRLASAQSDFFLLLTDRRLPRSRVAVPSARKVYFQSPTPLAN